MALKANRVGVRTDQVDAYGRITSKSFLQSILDHLPRWTSLKVWKNGTEQLLPVNTDEPVTSPIVADIRYPTDSSATEQMFTYRKSPTDADGEAYIKSIKGNTIKWNQLVQNGNFAAASNWTLPLGDNGTLSIANNEATVTLTADPTENYSTSIRQSNFPIKANHKCIFTAEVYLPKVSEFRFESGGGGQGFGVNVTTANAWIRIEKIWSRSQAVSSQVLTLYPMQVNGEYATGDVWKVRNAQCFDLTTMFGSTKADEIYAMETAQAGSGVAYFKSLFPLSYYKYDAGSLLSFNGTGIKTTGKNQFNINRTQGDTTGWANGQDQARPFDENYYYVGLAANNYFIPTNVTSYEVANDKVIVNSANGYGVGFPVKCLGGTKYTLSVGTRTNGSIALGFFDADGKFISSAFNIAIPYTFTTPTNTAWVLIDLYSTDNTNNATFSNIQLELGETGTEYTPYVEPSTTSIPTSTYFPTGMKSAGTAYDEFTSSRAYTRIGEVDLGSLRWTAVSTSGTNKRLVGEGIENLIKGVPANVVGNIICALYDTLSGNQVYQENIGISVNSSGVLSVYDPNYQAGATFKTAMDGVMLQYELAEEIVEPTLDFGE